MTTRQVLRTRMIQFHNRLSTLISLPDLLYFRCVRLAHAGFFHEHNQTKCFACGFVLKNLDDVAEPFYDHLHFSDKSCPYLLQTIGEDTLYSLALHNHTTDLSLEPYSTTRHGYCTTSITKNYYYYFSRLSTFKKYKGVLSPITLAHLGYVYDSDGDFCYCYDCKFVPSGSDNFRSYLEQHISVDHCNYMCLLYGHDVSNLENLDCLHMFMDNFDQT